jgi:PAS domain S-box-containing protein
LAADKVRLQLKWQHQFQFAGYYAAKAQGYYGQAGLDVDILAGDPGVEATQKVLKGEAEFGVGMTDLLLNRAKGEPVVVLASIFQHSAWALMALKKDGVQSVHDLARSPLMIESNSAELLAYLRREGLGKDQNLLISHNFRVQDLLDHKVDGMSVYVTDEPFELVKAGKEFVLYSPRSAGIDFYGDNLFTTEAQLKKYPDRVRRFREASLKGWQYAMKHPEEVAQLIYKDYGQRHTLAHLRYEAEQMVPLLRADLVEIGHMYRGRWQNIADVYAELGMLPPGFDLDGFLYDPNPPPPDLTWWYVGFGVLGIVGLIGTGIGLFVMRTNRHLRNSQRRFQMVFDTVPMAFIVSDRQHRITQWNSGAHDIFGWEREEALGKNLYELLVPASDLGQVRKVVGDTMEKVTETRSLNRNKCRDGRELLCEWHNATYLDDQGWVSGVISLGLDVSEREQARQRMQEAKDLAGQLLEDQKQFIAMVSHEFRSPLAVIDAASQVLSMQCETVCGSSEVISRVRRGVKRLAGFIDNCMAEDRLTQLEHEGLKAVFDSIEALPFLDSVIELAKLNAPEHRVSLEYQLPVAATLCGDVALIRILLLNLLGNACKYSKAGSEVALRAEPGKAGGVLFCIRDAGIGIPSTDQPSLGIRHFRGQNANKAGGAGLGLFLSRRIVALHGGEMQIQSAPGVGTTVCVNLPCEGNCGGNDDGLDVA